MSFNTYASAGWWERTRMYRYVFAAGLVVGVFAGWFFHGLISMVVQFGMVILLLLPLAFLGFMWWRSSRQRSQMQSSMTVVRWGNGQFPPYGGNVAADQMGRVRFEQDDVVDIDGAR